MIEVTNLTKRYGRQTAVDGVSFRVEKGEILGFLGPNGAGKTTTMRILTCYLPPTEGTARVAGLRRVRAAARGEAAGRLHPRDAAPLPGHERQDFLDFCAKIKGVPAGERKASASTTRSGSAAWATCAASSSASSPRATASAWAWPRPCSRNPDVLILDEPTAGLDPKQIIEIRELIKGLGGDHTVMLSTHILPEVSMTCGRVVIINKGRVVAEDTPDNLIRRLQGAGALRLEVRGEEAPASRPSRRCPECCT